MGSKLFGGPNIPLLYIGSPSEGALHLLRWKDHKGNKKTFRLVDRVSAGWHKFGILLGISQNQLKVWDEKYRGNSSMCWTKVMEHWLNGGGKDCYPATWEGLYTLLEDADYLQVAKDFKEVVDESMTEDSSVSTPDVDRVSTTPGNEDATPECKYKASLTILSYAIPFSYFQQR